MEPQSILEVALARAADDPVSRPEFYRTLLESKVYVIGFTDSPEMDGETTLSAGAKLSIVPWQQKDGTPVVPFFGSLEALRLALKEEARYVALAARDFFEITRGSHLVLNPASPYWKEFPPNEIEALLETGMNHVSTRREVKKATQVQLGQPANYPADMVSALTRLLAKHPSVKGAYLCLMHDPTSGEKPSLVVGFEGDGDISQAMREAGSVAADTAPKDELVDFVVLKREEKGMAEYMFGEVKPFYKRRWGAKLRSLFNPDRP